MAIFSFLLASNYSSIVFSKDLDKEAAAEFLKAKGLSPVGTVWCVSEEIQLKAIFDSLDKNERICATAQQMVDQIFQKNELAGVELNQVQTLLKQKQESQKSAPGGGPQRTALDEEVKQLTNRLSAVKQRFVPPNRWGQDPPLKPVLVDWLQTRQELTLAALAIRDLVGQIDARYVPMRENQQITQAIATLGGSSSLGPLKKYESELPRIAKLEQNTLFARIPAYREEGLFRTNFFLNEKIPATFTVLESNGPTWIPTSLAESAGIVVTANARRITIRGTPQRTYNVPVVLIPKLRIGKWVFKDVEAGLLPPEAEDLGAQISRDAIAGQKIIIDPKLLTIRADE